MWNRARGGIAALVLSVTVSSVVGMPSPAQAAGEMTLSRTGAGSITLDVGAASSTVFLGFDTATYTVPTVTLYSPGQGFASVPGDCAVQVDTAGSETAHCPADAVNALTANFGAGNDRLVQSNVCIDTITANMGEGGNKVEALTECATTINGTSGAGDDVFFMGGNGGTVSSGAGDDELNGGPGDDSFHAGPGNDRLAGNAGNDQLVGEDGNDSLRAGAGNDVESGGPGDDMIGDGDDDQGADVVMGGPGVDELRLNNHTGGGMVVNLDGLANDGIAGEGDNFHPDLEIIRGTPFDDTITGSAAAEKLVGWTGRDTIHGGAGNDEIDGESDDDVLFGGPGDDTIYGGHGNDQITGDAGADTLVGDYTSCCISNGADKIFAVDGAVDSVNCGGGADTLEADAGDVIGGDGNQVCESVTRVNAPVPPPGPGGPGGGAILSAGAVKGKPSLGKGVVMTITCASGCQVKGALKISKKLAKKLGVKPTLATGKAVRLDAGQVSLKLKVKKALARKIAKKFKGSKIPAVATLVGRTADGAAANTLTVKVKIKR